LTGKKTSFSDSEDSYILKMFLKIGSKWREIARGLPGRTGNQIKSRFYSFIKKRIERTKFNQNNEAEKKQTEE
jgi:myb proto-oncogene protein